MATAYSAPRQYSGYLKEWNTELLSTALNAKQQKYDAGREQAQAAYDNLLNIDLAKTEDKEYLQNKVSVLKAEVDRVGMGDLSIAGNVSNLTSYLGNAVDDKVLNGYAGTQAYRDYEAKWAKIEEDSPDKFNQANKDMGLVGYMKWISDGKVGSNLNSTEYSNAYSGTGIGAVIPFIDMAEEATKAIKNIVPEGYAEWDAVGGFTYLSTTGEKITDTRILNVLESTIMSNPKIKDQLRVNAWESYRGVDDATFVSGIQTQYEGIVSKYDDTIDAYSLQKLNATAKDKAAIQENIDYLTAQKKLYTDTDRNSPKAILDNRAGLEQQMYKENFLGGISKAFAYNSIKSKGFETNQGALGMWREGQANARNKATIKAAEDAELRKSRTDYIKYAKEQFDKGGDVTSAANAANAAYPQFNDAYDILNRPINESASPITTSNEQSTWVEENHNKDLIDASVNLTTSEKSLLGIFTEKGKNTYKTKGVYDKEGKPNLMGWDVVKSIPESEWAEKLRNKEVYGSWDQYQEKVLAYKEAERKSIIVNQKEQEIQDDISKGIVNNNAIISRVDNIMRTGNSFSGIKTSEFSYGVNKEGKYTVTNNWEKEAAFKDGVVSAILPFGEDNLLDIPSLTAERVRAATKTFNTEAEAREYLYNIQPEVQKVRNDVYASRFNEYDIQVPTTVVNDPLSASKFVELVSIARAGGYIVPGGKFDSELKGSDMVGNPTEMMANYTKNNEKLTTFPNTTIKYGTTGVTINMGKEGTVTIPIAALPPGSLKNDVLSKAYTMNVELDTGAEERSYFKQVDAGTTREIPDFTTPLKDTYGVPITEVYGLTKNGVKRTVNVNYEKIVVFDKPTKPITFYENGKQVTRNVVDEDNKAVKTYLVAYTMNDDGKGGLDKVILGQSILGDPNSKDLFSAKNISREQLINAKQEIVNRQLGR